MANISSTLSTGDTLDTLNLWFWMPKDLITDGTMERVWKYAIWDLLCCARGEFLPYDWDGNIIQARSYHPRQMRTGRIMAPHLRPYRQQQIYARPRPLRIWHPHQRGRLHSPRHDLRHLQLPSISSKDLERNAEYERIANHMTQNWSTFVP